ncbi:MAG: hypothetical protein JWL63_2601 [Rhodocyclales bacterium]|nr:hypothetical protein [Rhodocyclales bacterium]
MIKWVLMCSALFFGVALWQSNALPPSSALDASLQDEPLQRAVGKPAFETTVGDIAYTVQPLYSYDLAGLVVSRHATDSWWDYIHREWNDALNIADICVVWGNNARNGAYSKISFSNGQFTCNWSTSSSEDFAAFDQDAVSNNHLLSDNADVIRRIRKVRVGDQVRFRGYLAEYSHNHGFPFKRGTSIVRTDTGNGACETVYVESFEILQEGGGPWRKLSWLAGAMIVLSLIAWFFQPARFDD